MTDNKNVVVETDNQKAINIVRLYHKARIDEDAERTVWKQCFEYYNNWVDGKLGQWSSIQRENMGDRPMLSFNEVRKFVRRIFGNSILMRVEEKILPRDDVADPMVAEILNDLRKYVYDLNKADKISIAQALKDMIICGRGYVKCEWNDELDPIGEISMSYVNPFKVYLIGKGERYDLLDRTGIIEVLPMSKEDLLEWKPEYAGQINGLSDSMDSPLAGDDYLPEGGSVSVDDYYDKGENKFTVLRYQKREYTTVTFVKNPITGELVEPAPEVPIEEIPFEKLTKRMKRIRVTTVCGNVVLEDRISKYKHGRPDMVGFFGDMTMGRITGAVQDLIDPQNEKNKRRSAIIDILNKSPKGSLLVTKNLFDNIEEARKSIAKSTLTETNAAPGQLSGSISPVPTDLTALPAIIGMEQQSVQDMKDITGLGDASLGIVPEGVKSGRGLQELKGPSEVIISVFFDNLLLSRQLLAQMVISLVQQFYTEPRRVRILGDYTQRFIPPELKRAIEAGVVSIEEGAKIIQINTTALNDITVGRYDVVIDNVPYSPSERNRQYYDLLNMRAIGVPVPDEEIVRASDVRGKQSILAGLEMQRQLMALQAMGGKTASPSTSPPVPGDLMFNQAGVQNPQAGT